MELDEVYRALTAALRTAEERAHRSEKELAALQARFDQLIEVLVGRGALTEGHQAMFQRVGDQAAKDVPRKVKLRMYVDKYQMPNSGVDCTALMHLCHARCCTLTFSLTTQDLDEGKLLWEATAPYLIRHEADGYCSHLARDNGGCTVYTERPATCRGYDCRGDTRIWLDFEKRIVAPLPAGIAELPMKA